METVTATRYPTGIRVDLIDSYFLLEMGKIMSVGAEKYGEFNWKKGLSGEKGGVNHAFQHLAAYVGNQPNDYGPRETHLAQVAINAMFEFHFERQRRLTNENAEIEMDLEDERKKQEDEALLMRYANMSDDERKKFIKAASDLRNGKK